MAIALIGPEPIRRRPGAYRQMLQAEGFDLVYPDGEGTLTPAALRDLLPGVRVMMAGGERIDAEAMDLAPGLKIIARTGVGFDAIDVEAATRRGIAVTITPGTNHEAVAEQAFGLLFALTRRITHYDRLIRAGRWDRDVVRPIRGLTLGIVGLGRIGRAMVPRAFAFGMNVVAVDPVPDPEFDDRHHLTRLSLDDLLATSDVVSLHAPATVETRKLIDATTIGRMKPGAILLNTARGNLVDEAALLDALDSGQIGGAGLDVFDPEPPSPGNRLLAHPNVVASPHVAGIDAMSMDDMATLAARCMVEVHHGRWPIDCMVNRVST